MFWSGMLLTGRYLTSHQKDSTYLPTVKKINKINPDLLTHTLTIRVGNCKQTIFKHGLTKPILVWQMHISVFKFVSVAKPHRFEKTTTNKQKTTTKKKKKNKGDGQAKHTHL